MSDEAKAQLGRHATFIWLFVGAGAFLIDQGVSGLFSLRALAFLGLGMFVAAIVVGSIGYVLLNKMAVRLMARHPDPTTPEAQIAMKKWRNIFGLASSILAVTFVLAAYAAIF